MSNCLTQISLWLKFKNLFASQQLLNYVLVLIKL